MSFQWYIGLGFRGRRWYINDYIPDLEAVELNGLIWENLLARENMIYSYEFCKVWRFNFYKACWFEFYEVAV